MYQNQVWKLWNLAQSKEHGSVRVGLALHTHTHRSLPTVHCIDSESKEYSCQYSVSVCTCACAERERDRKRRGEGEGAVVGLQYKVFCKCWSRNGKYPRPCSCRANMVLMDPAL